MKYVFDTVISILILAILSPLILILILMSLFFLGWPIFFVQARPGLNGKIFNMIKFRTMANTRDKTGALLPDEQRMTKYGAFLRRTSLDEIPELINVLKGEMSLVGPRPLLVDYLPLYSQEQARRHLVRPGITGLAQISGRNNLPWEKRFNLDIYYVDNRSFGLDLKILIKTVLKVLRSEDIAQDGHVTMPKFEGSKKKTP